MMSTRLYASNIFARGELPSRISRSGAEAIDRVHRIRVLLSTGLSIADINALSFCFDEHPPGGALCRRAQARYRQKLDAIDRQIGMLQEIRARIIKLIQPEEEPF